MGSKSQTSKLKSTRSTKAPARKSPAEKKDEVKKKDEPRAGTKQEKVLGLLRRPEGVTVAALGKVTGWQQHSILGFLPAV